MSFLDGVKKAHIVGAGGIGVSAVAKLLHHLEKKVTGSDAAANEAVAELQAMGVEVIIGHDAANLPEDADLVVYSDAVPPSNVELAAAHAAGIRCLSYFEFLGEYSRTKKTIAVSGTNGKSTTTAMLGLILEAAGLDPTIIVGSKVSSFKDKNLRLGKSDLFLVEACEHNAHMLHLSPQMIVLTNIEEDHLDYYRDLAHIRETFQTYIEKLPEDGLLILNADDHVSATELKPKDEFATYGINLPADYKAENISVRDGRQQFTIAETWEGGLFDVELGVPGRFNISNALAAAAAAMELGVEPDIIAETLAKYPGIWRRFERVGERDGAPIISDYGHHPTPVAATLAAARDFFTDRKIILSFQPHHRNRTKRLFDEFVASFDGADALVLTEIYDVEGREDSADANVSSEDLVVAVKERDKQHDKVRVVVFAPGMDDTLVEIERLATPDSLIILMGAGRTYLLAEKLRR